MADDAKQALKIAKYLEVKLAKLQKELDKLRKDMDKLSTDSDKADKNLGEWAHKEIQAMEQRSVDRHNKADKRLTQLHNQQAKEMSSIIKWVKQLTA